MKQVALAAALLCSASAVFAADISGPSALALAALVGANQPGLSLKARGALAKFLDSRTDVDYPPSAKIAVNAHAVVCRASSVSIWSHSCELKFGGAPRMLKGRKAHELYATLAEAGVAPEGAAGSAIASIKMLACTIDPHAIKQNDGSGAACSFAPGP